MRRVGGRIAALVALSMAATVVAISGVTTSQASVVRRPLHEARSVGAAPVEPSFPVDFFGLVATLRGDPPAEVGRAPFGEVRFRRDGRWSGWQAIGADGAQAAGTFTAALIPAVRADAYQVRGLPSAFERPRGAAINTTSGPEIRRSGTPNAAAAATGCRSRADWNADESITAWTRGTDTPVFATPQVLTVHHTAGSNDPNQSFADTVRAIEVYHVRTNGWSDIGYQYLIDPNGVLYEGRYSGHTSRSCLTGGGDGSDFAHRTSDDATVTGAHVAGYNTGNVGVALLGCFEDSAACSGDTNPRQPAVDALAALLGDLSRRHGLDPQGTTTYSNGTNTKAGAPVVSGHRDWEATACPGSKLYALLPTLRQRAAQQEEPADDFALSVAPSAATTDAGSVVTATVQTSATGSAQQLSLSARADRSGIDVALAQSSLTAGSSTTLRITTTAAAAGQFTVTVTGTSATATRSAALTVTVANRAPTASIAGTCNGSRCSFTSTAGDPEGGPVTRAWTLPSANPSSAGDVASVSATYAGPGTYSVAMNITDVAGNRTSAVRTTSCQWSGKGKQRTLQCVVR